MAERADELDSWITNWERQCIEEVERAPDLESQIQNERDTSSQKLWLLFQNSATCVAQLYKDRQHGVSLWVPFQNAASSVTNLYKAQKTGFPEGHDEKVHSHCCYREVLPHRGHAGQMLWLRNRHERAKVQCHEVAENKWSGVLQLLPSHNFELLNLVPECLEAQRRVSELGYQSGYQRRTKDLLAWAKKRKRHIRREDLLAFLCGKAPHHHHHHHHGYHGWASPRQRLSLEPGSLRGVVATAAPSARLTPSAGERPTVVGQGDPDDVDLDTFREALAISSALGSSRNHGGGGVSPPGFRSAASLSNFIAEEFARHVESRKRTAPGSASPGDVVMDSPTHKRPRLI